MQGMLPLRFFAESLCFMTCFKEEDPYNKKERKPLQRKYLVGIVNMTAGDSKAKKDASDHRTI